MKTDFAESSGGMRESTMGPASSGPSGGLALRPAIKPKTQKPSLYSVIMLNDDYTTVAFVEDMLMRHFEKTREVAVILTQQVHKQGAAVAGTYSREIAETKAVVVMDEAKKKDFPFLLTLEKT